VNDVYTFGNPVLRKTAQPVPEVNDELRALADRMLGVMKAERGIGLAAEQIGRTEALCVINIPAGYDLDAEKRPFNLSVSMPLVLFNPEIIGSSKEAGVMEEGCLSFPSITTPVKRPVEVAVRFLNRDGSEEVFNARGLLARAIQHELDHLNGVLIFDHMSLLWKLRNALKLLNLWQKSRRS